jgi:hypothetical protein
MDAEYCDLGRGICGNNSHYRTIYTTGFSGLVSSEKYLHDALKAVWNKLFEFRILRELENTKW